MRARVDDPVHAGEVVGDEFAVGGGDGVVEGVVAENLDVAEGVVAQDGTEVGTVAVVNVVGDFGGAEGVGGADGVETVYRFSFHNVIVYGLSNVKCLDTTPISPPNFPPISPTPISHGCQTYFPYSFVGGCFNKPSNNSAIGWIFTTFSPCKVITLAPRIK